MEKRPHEQLELWKKSIDLVTEIYETTRPFPESERYGLVSQMRRAAVSVPCNIAEGASRRTNKEFIQFLYIGRGSLSELETLLEISNRLKLLESPFFRELRSKTDVLGRMLTGLITTLKKK